MGTTPSNPPVKALGDYQPAGLGFSSAQPSSSGGPFVSLLPWLAGAAVLGIVYLVGKGAGRDEALDEEDEELMDAYEAEQEEREVEEAEEDDEEDDDGEEPAAEGA